MFEHFLAAQDPVYATVLAELRDGTLRLSAPTNFMRDCDAPNGTIPFSFESGGVSLAGFIDPPDSPGPHPAILLIHGVIVAAPHLVPGGGRRAGTGVEGQAELADLHLGTVGQHGRFDAHAVVVGSVE